MFVGIQQMTNATTVANNIVVTLTFSAKVKRSVSFFSFSLFL